MWAPLSRSKTYYDFSDWPMDPSKKIGTECGHREKDKVRIVNVLLVK